MSKIKNVVEILAGFEKELDNIEKIVEEMKLKLLNEVEALANTKSMNIIEKFRAEKEIELKKEEEKAKKEAEDILRKGSELIEEKKKELEKKLEIAKKRVLEILL